MMTNQSIDTMLLDTISYELVYLYVICFCFQDLQALFLPLDLIVQCIPLWKLYILLRPAFTTLPCY